MRSLAVFALLFLHSPAETWAESPKVPPAPTVTLQGDALSVAEALGEVTKQTKIAVEDRRRKKDAHPLKLNLQNATFWQALDAIAKQADAKISLYERDGIPALVDGPNDEKPISYSGIFRVAIKRLNSVRNFDTKENYLTATLEIAWEPPFRPFLLETKPKRLRAKIQSDPDHDLSIVEPTGGQAPVEGKMALSVEVRLPAVPRPSAKLSLLEGEFSLIGASKMLTFTFAPLDELQKDAAKRTLTQDNVTVEVGKLILEKDLWTVEMGLKYPPGGPKFESFQSWLGNNEISLGKVGGEEHFPNNAGYALESSSSFRARLSYNFRDDKAGKKYRGKPGDWNLIYVTPSVISESVVPFSFKDVPLP